jgi:hypothetical protein
MTLHCFKTSFFDGILGDFYGVLGILGDFQGFYGKTCLIG